MMKGSTSSDRSAASMTSDGNVAKPSPALPVPVEVRTGEDAVLPITHLPYRDVRDNFLPLDQPAEELARPVGGVRGEPPWFQIKALFCSIQHGLCRGNFIIGASRRRLDIHDHGILDIDEVVQPVSELYALVGLGCPGRLGIRRRDHLGWLALITALPFALGPTTLVVILGIAISRRFGFRVPQDTQPPHAFAAASQSNRVH